MPEAINIDKKVQFLTQPNIYLDNSTKITVKETHMSWLFQTNHYVYKMKKPVKHDYLDLTTLAARHQNCTKEVELNSRLAKKIYLGVIPLSIDKNSQMQFSPKHQIIEYLIKMQRLPENQTLEEKIKRNALHKKDLIKLTKKLHTFYEKTEQVKISKGELIDWLEYNINYNQKNLKQINYKFLKTDLNKIIAQLLHFTRNNPKQFAQRCQQDKIVDAHGDLRPEHIFFTDPIQIIDCLEFSKKLRCLDIAEELAYLCMECDILGANPITNIIFSEYQQLANDSINPSLLYFYKASRALLRARLVIQHILETQYQQDKKWIEKSSNYLQLAQNYCLFLN